MSFLVGENVFVENRTSPGMNKPGGYGRIAKKNIDDGTYSVKYFLGGSEKNLMASLISKYDPLVVRKRQPSLSTPSDDAENQCSASAAAAKKTPLELQQEPQRSDAKKRRRVAAAGDGDDAGGGDRSTTTVEDATDGGAKPLRDRWGIKRIYTAGDCWLTVQAALSTDGTTLLNRDVGHTGCCKGYSLATLLRGEFDGRGVPTREDREGKGGAVASGAVNRRGAPPRRELDVHVRAWRAVLAQALTAEELKRLRSDGATNHSDWRRFTSLEEARTRVAMSYDAARKVGHSMSPVWLEEWETSIICRHESARLAAAAAAAAEASIGDSGSEGAMASGRLSPGADFRCGCVEGASTCAMCSPPPAATAADVRSEARCSGTSGSTGVDPSSLSRALVIVEIHDGSPSKASRSCFQLVLPSPDHRISETDTVIVLRRIQCHYNPCWLNGKPRATVKQLPKSFRKFFGV
jgi:hypothetical protein